MRIESGHPILAGAYVGNCNARTPESLSGGVRLRDNVVASMPGGWTVDVFAGQGEHEL
jgi:hypothetical protein